MSTKNEREENSNQFYIEIAEKIFSKQNVTKEDKQKLCEKLIEHFILKDNSLKEKNLKEWDPSLWTANLMAFELDTKGFQSLVKDYHLLLESGLDELEMGCVFSIFRMFYDQDFSLFDGLANNADAKEEQTKNPLINEQKWIECLSNITAPADLAETLDWDLLKCEAEICLNPACITIEKFYNRIQSKKFSNYLEKRTKVN